MFSERIRLSVERRVHGIKIHNKILENNIVIKFCKAAPQDTVALPRVRAAVSCRHLLSSSAARSLPLAAAPRRLLAWARTALTLTLCRNPEMAMAFDVLKVYIDVNLH